MDAIVLPSSVLVAIAASFGLLIGSFLNVVIHRLPLGESVVSPGSRCPGCGSAVRWYDNVPLISYLGLRGRCRDCGASISARYPAIEFITGLMFAAIAFRFGATPMLPVWCVFAAALLATAAIDFDHQIIPDELSVGGMIAALAVVPAVQAYAGASYGEALTRSALGALVGGGLLWIVGFGHARLSVAAGRTFEHWPGAGETLPKPSSLDYWTWFPGLGFGDVKLLAMIGAVLGPLGVMKTIIAASVAGLVLGLGGALFTRSWNTPFGFAPAIALGAVLALFVPGWPAPF